MEFNVWILFLLMPMLAYCQSRKFWTVLSRIETHETLSNFIEDLPNIFEIEVVFINISSTQRPKIDKYPYFSDGTKNNSILFDIFQGKPMERINILNDKKEFLNKSRKEFVYTDNTLNNIKEFILLSDGCIKWQVKVYYVPFNTRLNEAISDCSQDNLCISNAIKEETKGNSRSIAVYISMNKEEVEIDKNIYIKQNFNLKEDEEFIKRISKKYLEHKKQYVKFAQSICNIKDNIMIYIKEEYLNISLLYRVPYEILENFKETWEKFIKKIRSRLLLTATMDNELYTLVDEEEIERIKLVFKKTTDYLVAQHKYFPVLLS